MALFSIDVNINLNGSSVDTLNKVLSIVEALSTKVTNMAKTLEDVAAQLEVQSTVADGIATLLATVKAKLDEVLSGTVVPPGVQAKIDAIFERDEAITKKLQDAILANTPEEPTP